MKKEKLRVCFRALGVDGLLETCPLEGQVVVCRRVVFGDIEGACMGEALTEMSCRSFSSELAAKTPTPGGGATSALVGALAASLCSMAAQFTVGKEGYGDVEADMRRLISEVADLRLHLLDLVEEDAAAYASLSVVLRMPKDEPKRVSELEEALKTSAAVPIDTMHSVCRVIELLEEVGEKGSRLLSSDVGCGASFASAALQAASLTVFVNTKISIDCQWAKQLESSCALMINEYVPRAQLVVEKMADRVRRRG